MHKLSKEVKAALSGCYDKARKKFEGEPNYKSTWEEMAKLLLPCVEKALGRTDLLVDVRAAEDLAARYVYEVEVMVSSDAKPGDTIHIRPIGDENVV